MEGLHSRMAAKTPGHVELEWKGRNRLAGSQLYSTVL